MIFDMVKFYSMTLKAIHHIKYNNCFPNRFKEYDRYLMSKILCSKCVDCRGTNRVPTPLSKIL